MISRRLRLVGVLALAASLAACAGAQPTSGPSGEENDAEVSIPIRIGYTASGLSRLYTAMSLDLFEKNGLDAELIRFESGAASAAAFKAGSVDVGFTGIPGFASARLNGSDVQIFLTESEEGAGVELVAHPESGIATVRDLVGKKVGTAVGAVGYIGLIEALADEGIEPTELEIVNLAPNTWISSFRAKEVDAIFAFSPANYLLEAEGGTSITSLDQYALHPIVWIGRADFLEDETGGEAASRFIAALDEAGDLYPENEDEVLGFMAAQNGQPVEIGAQVVEGHELISYADQLQSDHLWSLTNPDEGLVPTTESYVSLLRDAGVLADSPDLAGAFNSAPLERFTGGQIK